MKKRNIFMIGILALLIVAIIVWVKTPRTKNVSELINLNQKNYQSIEVNDKIIEVGTDEQYLIDDFISKLERYNVRTFDERLPYDFNYQVIIKQKDGSEFFLYDNEFIVINDYKYQIVNGEIDLGKFYTNFMK